MKKSQSGFTLIEMVAVIILLAIMAAIAFPKFANLTGQARLASLNSLAGSMRSAAMLAKATWLANNNTNAQSVSMNGTYVSIIYPALAPASDLIWGTPTNNAAIGYALDDGTDGYLSAILGGQSGVAWFPKGVAVSRTCMAWYASGTVTLAASAVAGQSNGCL